MQPKQITIVGLGLIGGSMALALRRAGGCELTGIDADPAVARAALERGAIHRAGGPQPPADTDLLILALPPDAAIGYVRRYAGNLRPGTIVTDVCGVKRAVTDACLPVCRENRLHFLGGHPMAGKEKSGFANADADLFTGASYILTPAPDTPEQVVDTVRSLAQAIGCTRLTVTTPEQHDRMIAFTSQLPHVLAGAYVKSPCCPFHDGFSAGSYRDVSRVASVDETLWSRLFLLNRDCLCGEIDGLIENLTACRDALLAEDEPRLREVLRQGREVKEQEAAREAAKNREAAE